MIDRPSGLRRRAAIDLGTNTCLLLIADVDAHGNVQAIVEDHAQVVRLGQGVDRAKGLHPDAKDRTLRCLEAYCGHLRRVGVDPQDVVSVATSQARDANDAALFFSEIQAKLGLRFQTLTGPQEAAASFRGALVPGRDSAEQAYVIDIGGGSTEFRSMVGGLSLDLGAVRFTERFFGTDPEVAISDTAFWQAEEAIDAILSAAEQRLRPIFHDRNGIGVAGTVTTLAALQLGVQSFDADRLNAVTLTKGDLHRWVEELKWRTPAERQRDLGMDPGRADVLLAGAMILWRSMERFSLAPIRVSTRGLRFGVFTLN